MVSILFVSVPSSISIFFTKIKNASCIKIVRQAYVRLMINVDKVPCKTKPYILLKLDWQIGEQFLVF